MRLKLIGVAQVAITVFAQSQPGTSPATRNPAAAAAPELIEVASIKLSDPASCKEYPIIDDHGDRYDMTCVKARFLVQLAFDVRDFQILNAPGWLESTQYDIAVKTAFSPGVGTAPDKDVSELTDHERQTRGERLRIIVQSLLADRFQLKVHRDTKELPVFLLSVARGGTKLKSGDKATDVSGGLRSGRGFLAGTQTGIPFLAQTLSQIVGRPILDRTGLTGKYDFKLQWAPDLSSPNGPLGGALPPLPSADPDRPNIFTAIQEQLGLKLDSSKGRVEVIVVDHVERASAN